MSLKVVSLVGLWCVALTLADRPCTPDQFEGIAIGQFANDPKYHFASIASFEHRFARDFANKTEFVDETITYLGTELHVHRYKLYHQHVEFEFLPALGVCTARKIGNMTAQCVPDEATVFLKEVSYGADKVDVYMMGVEGKFAINWAWTADDHLPVNEAFQVHFPGDNQFAFLEFVNVTKGIADPDIFTPPKQCKKALEKIQEANESISHSFFGFP